VTQYLRTTGELDRLKAVASLPRTAQQKAIGEPITKRAARMRERLKAGGELAQATMRELFPSAIWLEADKSGRFLWARADGVPAKNGLAEGFSRIYAAQMDQVAVSGSGGTLREFPTGHTAPLILVAAWL
jgi:hypothetical protein